MKVGDFVVSHNAFGEIGITKITSLEANYCIVKNISYKKAHANYFMHCDKTSENILLVGYTCVINQIKEFSFEEFAKILTEQPLIRPSEKANLAEFLKQKLIEYFGTPPKVKPNNPYIGSSFDSFLGEMKLKPAVVEGQVSGFIRINNS